MKSLITVRPFDSFLSTESAVLWSMFDKASSTRKSFRCGLSSIPDAELSFAIAYRNWKSKNDQLKSRAFKQKQVLAYQDAPAGFQEAFSVQDRRLSLLLHMCETNVSSVLEATYALNERIATATKSLNAHFEDRVWPGCTLKQAGVKGKNRHVEQNLIIALQRDPEYKTGEELSKHILRVVEWRGDRTHRTHFFAHIEFEPLVTVYQDSLIYGQVGGRVRFSDQDFVNHCYAVTTYLRWWVNRTAEQLKSLT